MEWEYECPKCNASNMLSLDKFDIKYGDAQGETRCDECDQRLYFDLVIKFSIETMGS
jgi:transcription elongation factor Elf1